MIFIVELRVILQNPEKSKETIPNLHVANTLDFFADVRKGKGTMIIGNNHLPMMEQLAEEMGIKKTGKQRDWNKVPDPAMVGGYYRERNTLVVILQRRMARHANQIIEAFKRTLLENGGHPTLQEMKIEKRYIPTRKKSA